MAHFTAAQLEVTFLLVIGCLGLGMVTFCRRPGSQLSPGQWATEIALMLLATLWLSPVTWSYHPTAALPALAIVLTLPPQAVAGVAGDSRLAFRSDSFGLADRPCLRRPSLADAVVGRTAGGDPAGGSFGRIAGGACRRCWSLVEVGSLLGGSRRLSTYRHPAIIDDSGRFPHATLARRAQ